MSLTTDIYDYIRETKEYGKPSDDYIDFFLGNTRGIHNQLASDIAMSRFY